MLYFFLIPVYIQRLLDLPQVKALMLLKGDVHTVLELLLLLIQGSL